MAKGWPLALTLLTLLCVAVFVPACGDDSSDSCGCSSGCCYDSGCGGYYTGSGCPDGCCPPGEAGYCSGATFYCA